MATSSALSSTAPTEKAATPSMQWQQTNPSEHVVMRGLMILHLQKLHPLFRSNTALHHGDGNVTRVPDLVRRLELMLYKAAHSMEEYMNPCTIERRVHSLVTFLETPLMKKYTALTRKRRLEHQDSPVETRSKRRRSLGATTVSIPVGAVCEQMNRLCLQGNVDLLQLIFQYLDGVETWRCRSINRFFYTTAPLLVQSLHWEISNTAAVANLLEPGRLYSVLVACENLQALKITNVRALEKPMGFTRAFQSTVSQEKVRSCTGEALLMAVHDAFSTSSGVLCPKLTRLRLHSPFDAAGESESALLSLEAIAMHKLQHPNARPLVELTFECTALGDRRMQRLGDLLERLPRAFKWLETLNLTGNFIGQAGLNALVRGLSSPEYRSLRFLSLQRNILADRDGQVLSQLLESPESLPALQVIDLSENYIGIEGFSALVKLSTTKGLSSRQLLILSALNCLTPQDAAQLFRY